jgi:RNA-binding protein
MTEESKPSTADKSSCEDDGVPSLAGFQRKHLRSLAHPLKPMVQIGKAGVTEEVIRTVKRALEDHELIKVSMTKPKDKKGMSTALAQRCGAHLCGLLGHTIILFKQREKRPEIRVPSR